MRKLLKNSKGFAMAELLAVCIIVLGIFSMLFANYLPLLAEYENRISYNNVTAQYASHYIRKMYKTALEGGSGTTLKNTINSGISSGNGVFEVYGKNNTRILSQLSSNRETLEKLIENYGIEEIAITKYILTNAKSNYNKDSLKNYINYLPTYKNSIYTGANAEDNMELYRLIIKTKNYGYATTPILSDYNTPSECFTGEYGTGGIIITSYDDDNELCTDVVTIGSSRISVKSNSGNGTVTGRVVGIGAEVFKGKKITAISYPSTVKSIGNEAFSGSKLETFEIGEGVKTIGQRAFYNTQLTQIELSGGITYGDEAFANNKNLTKIDFTSNITTMGTGLFSGSGTSKSGLIINTKSLRIIPAETFKGSKLASLTFGTALRTIGNEAFQNATTNTSGIAVEIPASVTTIGTNSFSKVKISSLTLNNPTNSLTIGANAFNDATISGGVSIPANVTQIGENAFYSTGIDSLAFEDGSKITTIGANAFAGNRIPNLALPNSLTTIGEGAFRNNTSLTEANLPSNNNYQTVSNNLFNGAKLTSITIPDNVTTIGTNAFYNNDLQEIIIADTSKLQSIGSQAFSGNSKVTSINIPASVTTIGTNAFSGCTNLGLVEGNFINNSSSNFEWCNIFYGDNTCEITTEGVNTYVKYQGVSDKIIVRGGTQNE